MKINPKVVSDRFDDEIVVVNLESGIYYSFRNSAIRIWSLLEQGATVNTIVDGFEALTDEQRSSLDGFLTFLKSENLVVDSEVTTVVPADKISFSQPEYSRFEDMADLIMLDPIHEADQAKGWPHKQE